MVVGVDASWWVGCIVMGRLVSSGGMWNVRCEVYVGREQAYHPSGVIFVFLHAPSSVPLSVLSSIVSGVPFLTLTHRKTGGVHALER